MKKLFTLTLVALAIYGCSKKQPSKQEVAEGNVRAFLLENLNDTTGYQSVSFDSIRPRYSTYIDTLTYSAVDTLIMSDEIIQKEDSLRKAFKPTFLGYELTHKFRARNGFNALVLDEKTFNLDSNLKVISID